MRPLTYVLPKCLLPIGGKPLLEKTMVYLKSYGINEFVLCVAYLKNQIIDRFGDGNALGVKIEYAESEVPMGTGGQLRTAAPFLRSTFLAMNGDIVTDLNVGKLIAKHLKVGGIATIALKEFGVKIPYGHIITSEDGGVKAFEEKPTLNYMANAGVYVMEPRLLDSIQSGKVSSLETDVFPKLISNGEKINAFFESAYWADVGSMADFERVNDEALTDPSIVAPRRQH